MSNSPEPLLAGKGVLYDREAVKMPTRTESGWTHGSRAASRLVDVLPHLWRVRRTASYSTTHAQTLRIGLYLWKKRS